MAPLFQEYSLSEIMDMLKRNDFKEFDFSDTLASVILKDQERYGIELLFQLENKTISSELISTAINVLEHFSECRNKAKEWLERFRTDEKFPHMFDEGFIVNGLFFGDVVSGHNPFPARNSFTISFAPVNYYPCNYTVKYHRCNLTPFAVEEWVE